jgi:membrane protease YdiL (CAAX protease family)
MGAKRLRWSDAAASFGLAVAGMFIAGAALHMHWLPGIVATYAAHAWLAVIALAWYFWLGRPFPVGTLNRHELVPWSVLCLLAIVVSALQAFTSPPNAVHLPALPLLTAELVFLTLVVGPTEELLFRGVVQTGVNGSVSWGLQLFGWPLRLGTLMAAALFGFSHLVNLSYQSIATTAEQVVTATAIGFVIGVVYDRTRNLIGAAVLHSVLDLTGTALPWVAYFVLHR